MLVLAVLLLGLLELAAQTWVRVRRGENLYDRSRFSRELEPHPYLVGQFRENRSTEQDGTRIHITANRTRHTGEPAQADARVACLGGSTTFGTLVSDEDTWVAQLQSLLGSGVAVRNYGVPGYSSMENVIQMTSVVPEFAPHVVVVYQGWNDLRSAHAEGPRYDYYWHGMHQYELLDVGAPGERNDWPRFIRGTGLMWLAGKFLPEPQPPGPIQDGPLRQDPDLELERVYARNLQTIKVLARNMGAAVVFVPQILNDARFERSDEARRWTPNLADSAVPVLVRRLNTRMLDACADHGCEYVTAVESIAWNPQHFVDDGHFNAHGGRLFAGALAPSVRAALRTRVETD